MGLSTPALKYILSRSQKYRFKGPLLTYGNQDIYTNYKTLQKWADKLKLKPIHLNQVHPSTSLGLSEINSQSQNFIHAKTFFAQIGIKEKDYYDVDKFNFDHPRITHDLETPFPKKYQNYFNLVIDSGTLEHIFDIKSVMTNTIKITRLGGYVLQLIPTNNFINHGFYQLSPTFFYDFYIANGFKIIESFLVEFRPNCYRFHKFNQKKFNTFYINPYSRVASLFLVRKIKKIKTISSPTQYAYQQVAKHKKSSPFDKITNILRHLLPFKYHAFFYIPWVIYKQLTSQKKYFDIKF